MTTLAHDHSATVSTTTRALRHGLLAWSLGLAAASLIAACLLALAADEGVVALWASWMVFPLVTPIAFAVAFERAIQLDLFLVAALLLVSLVSLLVALVSGLAATGERAH